jgi:nicotinamide mononucleotide transporter
MFKVWNLFEKCLFGVNLVVSIMFLVMGKDYSILPWLSLISAIANTLSVILTAKKKVINFFWGTIGVVSYTIVAFAYKNTGEWMLNAFYYFPMNIIAWITWYKVSSDKINVRARALSLMQIIFGGIVTGIAIVAYAKFISLPSLQIFLYGKLTGFTFYKYLIDSFTVVFSIVGMIILVKRFREQWIIWIAVDVMSIVLWCFTFNPTMILLWATMLINAVYGFVKWKKVEDV